MGLISGGGSGHEPMHGGYVGRGMLDAALPGEVFTSPTPDQMLAATKAVDGGAGVVHIVKNYTGDVLNFEMAAELAQGEGIQVDTVLTNDDVAVEDSLYTAGRRGVGVTVLVEKIAGAAAGARPRGRAEAGDKTMVDALIPGVEALEQASELDDGLRAASEAAREGMLATTSLVARKGRASYLGERSAGHQDPGATSDLLPVRERCAGARRLTFLLRPKGTLQWRNTRQHWTREPRAPER